MKVCECCGELVMPGEPARVLFALVDGEASPVVAGHVWCVDQVQEDLSARYGIPHVAEVWI